MEKDVPKQQTIKQTIEKNFYPLKSEKRKKLNTFVLKHIVEDLQPISIVQQKGFRKLVHALDPKYVLPIRQTVVKLLKKAHQNVNLKIVEEMKKVSFVAITTDMWSSKESKDSYNGITVHYWISESATLKSRVLECGQFKNAHTSEQLSADIMRILKDFGIESKISAALSDNAANIKKALKDLLKLPWMGCLAHGLNLVFEDAYKASRFLKDLRNKVSKIVGFINRSSTGKLKFKKCKETAKTPDHQLTQDVTTRWNR